MEWVKKGKYTLAEAIKAAMVHEETRALYFTAYVTMSKRAAGKGQGDGNPSKWQKTKAKGKGETKTGKGETKVKGKGKNGKAAGTKGGMKITSTTPRQPHDLL